MASAKQNETLLLTEHFTWPPISLLDDIINTVNDTLYSCTDTLESGLLSAPPSYLGFSSPQPSSSSTNDAADKLAERARLEIEEGAQKLETLMIDAVDRNFDRLEIWTLRNVLCLPREEGFERWVRLGHYEGVGDAKRGGEGESVTMEGVYEVRRRLAETRRLNGVLRGEERRNERVIEGLRRVLKPVEKKQGRTSTASVAAEGGAEGVGGEEAPLAFLTHSAGAQALGVQGLPAQGKGEKRTPLGTHASFTVSQLPYLRAQLEELKARLGSDALKGGKGDGGEKAGERRTYVESQSRRILEKRGVDTRDGVEGNFEGQMVRVDEIGALEGIVKAVGERGEQGKGKNAEEGDGEGEGEAMDTS